VGVKSVQVWTEQEGFRRMLCCCVGLVLTDVSEERIASIFRVEKSASEEPVRAGGCRLSHQSEITSYIRSEQSETESRPHEKPSVEWGGGGLVCVEGQKQVAVKCL
jgi:hypothetical protein